MTSRTAVLPLLLPMLAALACAGGEQAEQQEEQAMQSMEAASEASAAMTLTALNNSGVAGTAQLSHGQDALNVTLNLTGLTPGESYPAHIHRGSCQQDGPVAAPLGSAKAASDGKGAIEASVPMDKFQMSQGMKEGEHAMAEGEGMMEEDQEEHMGFSVRVHLPDGTPAACTDIKAQRGGMM